MPGIGLQSITSEIEQLAVRADSAEALMQGMVHTLAARLPHYNWVGFYLLEPGDDPHLVLGPYVGAPTPHIRIPLNQGICGAAASSGETLVVDDVGSDPRYLACSLETRSEIVVPVTVRGQVVGELDVDSHTPAAFTPDDRALCERCARIVADYMESHAH